MCPRGLPRCEARWVRAVLKLMTWMRLRESWSAEPESLDDAEEREAPGAGAEVEMHKVTGEVAKHMQTHAQVFEERREPSRPTPLSGSRCSLRS